MWTELSARFGQILMTPSHAGWGQGFNPWMSLVLARLLILATRFVVGNALFDINVCDYSTSDKSIIRVSIGRQEGQVQKNLFAKAALLFLAIAKRLIHFFAPGVSLIFYARLKVINRHSVRSGKNETKLSIDRPSCRCTEQKGCHFG